MMRRVPLGSSRPVSWGFNPQERLSLLSQQVKDMEPLVTHVGDQEQEVQQDLTEIDVKIQETRQAIQTRIEYLRQFSREAIPGMLEELQAMQQRLESMGGVSSEEGDGGGESGE